MSKFVHIVPIFILGVMSSCKKEDHRETINDANPASEAMLQSTQLPERVSPASLLGSLPLRFEASPSVGTGANFVGRGNNFDLVLSPAGISIGVPATTAGGMNLTGSGDPTGFTVWGMSFVGSTVAPEVIGLDLQSSVSNYYVGNDPTAWQYALANYGRIRVQSLYPGINLDYYGDQGHLKYDFLVAPGVDPKIIVMRFNDVESIRLDTDGNLILATIDGDDVVHKAPVIYQNVAGARVAVAGGFLISEGSSVSFAIGAYDMRIELVIDPVIEFSTLEGGSGNDLALDVVVDSQGFAIVSGTSTSADFPLVNSVQGKMGSSADAFVMKVDVSNRTIVFSTFFGGATGIENGAVVDVDPAGNIYLTGSTTSSDLATKGSPAPVQSQKNGFQSAFVAKFDAVTGSLVYSTYLDGMNGFSRGTGIKSVGDGTAWIVGVTQGTGFPVTCCQTVSGPGSVDTFLTRINAGGSALIVSTRYGGPDNDWGRRIALDGSGGIVVTGETFSTTLPLSISGPMGQSSGAGDGFVAKWNEGTGGSSVNLVFSLFLGGSGSDAAAQVATDSERNFYVVGTTGSANFPTHNPYQATLRGTHDAFAAKFDPAGGLIYSTYLGGTGYEDGSGLVVDSAGRLHVTGTTQGASFPNNFPLVNPIAETGTIHTAYVSVFDPSGASLVFSTTIGGASVISGQDIALDRSGRIYLIGYTNNGLFPTLNPLQLGIAGGYDLFLVRLSAVAAPEPVQRIPDIVLLANQAFTYELQPFLGDLGSASAFKLVSGPHGLILNLETGMLSWTPSATQLAAAGIDGFLVTIRMTAGLDSSETLGLESFRIRVQL